MKGDVLKIEGANSRNQLIDRPFDSLTPICYLSTDGPILRALPPRPDTPLHHRRYEDALRSRG
jgi:hypothetical protein